MKERITKVEMADAPDVSRQLTELFQVREGSRRNTDPAIMH